MDCKNYFIFLVGLLLFRRAKAAPITISQTELQNFVEPESYSLLINISRTGMTPSLFGQVKIKVRCVKTSHMMILNVKNMEIVSTRVGVNLITESGVLINNLTVKKSDFYEDKPESGLFVIDIEEALEENKNYEVSINSFNVDTQSSYFEEQVWYDFERNWISQEILQIVSRVTLGGASQLFPCFEETNVKTKFKIAIAHDKDLIALSNWPLQPEEENSKIVHTGLLPNQVRVEFEETAPMLPSGVSFAVVDLKSTEIDNPPAQVLIRVWAEEKSFEQLEVVKEIAMNAMLFYLDYLRVSLESTKLDIVAIPKIDLDEMDKLGLVKMEESSLLCSDGDEQKYFDITWNMCFTINHQWIGSTVTLSNSNKNYFHHALSYFLEELCIDKVNPNSDFNFIDLRNVIIFNNVLMPSWDRPSYSEFESVISHKLPNGNTQKAVQLIRMLFSFLKEKPFQDGLEAYIKQSKKSLSSVDNLWKAFTTVAMEAKPKILDENMSVTKIIDSYTQRSRFPLIRMKVDSVDSSTTVTISQETFRFVGEEKDDVENICWPIPLIFSSKTGRRFDGSDIPKWLNCEKTESFKVDLGLEEWIIVNSGLNGFGRIHLDDNNWKSIQKTLLYDKEFRNLSELTRANLLLDMFALAETGEVLYGRVFQTMKYLSNEQSALCWIIALTEFNKIYSYLLGETNLLERFQNYVIQILEPRFGGHSTVQIQHDKNSNKKSEELLTSTERAIRDYNFSKIIFDGSVNAENESKVENAKKPSGSLINIDDLPENDRIKRELQKLFVKTACKFGVGDCEDQSIALYQKWQESIKNKELQIKKIPLDIRDVVLCHTIKWSPKEVWNDIWKIYDSSKTSKENDIILKACGCSTNEETLQEYLNITMEETYPGDHLKAFLSLSTNKIGYRLMKTFLMENVENLGNLIQKSWKDQSIKLEMYFIELLSITTDRQDMTELVNFTKQDDVAAALKLDSPSKLLEKSIERASRNVFWLENNKSTFLEQLNSSL